MSRKQEFVQESFIGPTELEITADHWTLSDQFDEMINQKLRGKTNGALHCRLANSTLLGQNITSNYPYSIAELSDWVF